MQDNDASGGATLVCYSVVDGCTNSGNNTNWTLRIPEAGTRTWAPSGCRDSGSEEEGLLRPYFFVATPSALRRRSTERKMTPFSVHTKR